MSVGPPQGSGLEPGQSVGAYRIESLLGRGGMGAVFRAHDTTLQRPVALKVLSGAADDQTVRDRLLREARNAAALAHPSICTVYEVGDASGTAFIAMEYVEGRSLRDRLDQGPLPLDDAIRFAKQAADGLAYAHARGVVHRDFKAANAIVTDSGWLKIVDFGLARRTDALTAEATTMVSLVPAGVAAGTPYAMAPEQVRGEPCDARTDVWALGVLLYEMVSGTQPFTGGTSIELLSSILRDAPRPLPNAVPNAIRAVIARCLEKDPARRYQTATELAASLEAIRGDSVTQPQLPVVSRRWLPVAIGVAAVVLAGLALLSLRDRFVAPAPVAVRLAVLPLENRTGDQAQDDVSDGLTTQLIAALGRQAPQQLTVIPRAASMPYKQSAKTLAAIGRELNVGNILKGLVTRSGDRVQIAAELLEASDGRSLWSESYERAAGDLFGIEGEIARAVTTSLGLQQTAAPAPAAASRPSNPQAYELYLRGLSHAFRVDEKDLDQAIDLFEQSAALDPTFVPTQAYMAWAYSNKFTTYRPREPEWEEKGFAAVQRALRLDPESPEAHYAQAYLLWTPSHGFPSREALAELRKALAIQPNLDEALHMHGVVLMHVGHIDAAAGEIQRVLEINPSHTLARFRFGPLNVYQLRFEEAITALNRVPREAFPAQWAFQRAAALISLGRLDEAERLVDTSLTENPVDQGGVLHASRAILRAMRGNRSGAEADVQEAVRVGRSFLHFHHTAYAIGVVYSILGDYDKAQEWIENAANDGFPNFTFFEKDPLLEKLRAGSPRFRTFLTRLRQEWEHIPGEMN